MGQGTFRVVLTGEVIEGFERGLVVSAVAKLFKCPAPQAERILQGKSTSLKREMDADTAKRYQERLTLSGIASRLDPVAPPPVKLELSLEEDPPEPAPNSVPPSPTPDGSSAALPIRPVAPPENTPVPNWSLVEDESAEANEAAATAGGFQCPKCGTPQEPGAECIKCGIIFAKYQAPETPIVITSVEPEEEEEDDTDEWAELALFVGPNKEKYQRKFRELYQSDGKYQVHWHWPAYLVPVPWMIYRKLYPWAAVYLLLSLVFPPVALLILGILPGLMGNYLYYRHALWRIGKITSSGDERRDEIIRAGGTNSMVVTIGGTLLVAILMSVVYSQFFMPPAVKQAMDKSTANRQELLSVKDDPTKVQMLMLKNGLLVHKKMKEALKEPFIMPQDMDELRQEMALPRNAAQDKWGTQMQFEMNGDTMVFRAAGGDKQFGTGDDIVLETKE